ncbi:MAG: hypothetical protein WD669_00775 [Pirellulales bacterium]
MSDETAEVVEVPRWPRRFRFSLLTMFLVVTAVCIGFALLYRQHGAEAEVRFRVGARPTAFVGEEAGRFDAREYAILQSTQVDLIKSAWLIQAALRDPKVSRIPFLADRGDVVEWLVERLQVDFPQQNEILSIRLRGSREDATDLKCVVDAVARAYEESVLHADRQQMLAQRQNRASQVRDLRDSVEGTMRRIGELKSKVGEEDASVKTLEMELEMRIAQWREATKKLDEIDANKYAQPRVHLIQQAVVREW